MKITKSKLNELLSLYNSASKVSTCQLWYRDMIYPVTLAHENDLSEWKFGTDNVNGVHLIQNLLITMPDDIMCLSDPCGIATIKEELKKVGIQHIEMEINSELGYMISITDREGNTSTNRLLAIIPSDEEIKNKYLFESFDNRHKYLLSLGINYTVKEEQILNIINGYRTNLTGCIGIYEKTTYVRVSKNTFPLLGPARKDDSNAMKITYTFVNASISGPVIILSVQYKKLNAIHIYSYIEY